MELYRIHRAVDRGGSSYGEWQYFEDKDYFLRYLLEATLEEKMNGLNRINRKAYIFYSLWDKFIRKSNGQKDEHFPRVKAIHHVEAIVDGEWQPLEVEFIPPSVNIK